MNWTLEVITLPVSDVDRAKAFYADQVGFDVDHDSEFVKDMRVVQLTPPGSGCSIVVGNGLIDSPPGSVKGLQLVVPDVRAARAELVERGVDVSENRGFHSRGASPGARRRRARQRRHRPVQRPGRQPLGRAADLVSGIAADPLHFRAR
jgi:catechol 2,3-dioxygenase-like lactoylglutathione lyase family enzyme